MIANSNAEEIEMESTFTTAAVSNESQNEVSSKDDRANNKRIECIGKCQVKGGGSKASGNTIVKIKPPVSKKYAEPPPAYSNVASSSKDKSKHSQKSAAKYDTKSGANQSDVTIDLSSFPVPNNPAEEYSKVSDNRDITNPLPPPPPFCPLSDKRLSSHLADDKHATSRHQDPAISRGRCHERDSCQSSNALKSKHRINTTFPATGASPEAVLQPIPFSEATQNNCDSFVMDKQQKCTHVDKHYCEQQVKWQHSANDRKPTCHGKTNSVEIKVYEKFDSFSATVNNT